MQKNYSVALFFKAYLLQNLKNERPFYIISFTVKIKNIVLYATPLPKLYLHNPSYTALIRHYNWDLCKIAATA